VQHASRESAKGNSVSVAVVIPSPMSNFGRATTRCPSCHLNQFSSERCKRCHLPFVEYPVKPLSSPVVATLPSPTPLSLEKAVAASVKLLRLASGLSQKQLAKKYGTVRPWVSKVERGECVPGLTSFLKLAEALETSPGVVLQLAECLQGAMA